MASESEKQIAINDKFLQDQFENYNSSSLSIWYFTNRSSINDFHLEIRSNRSHHNPLTFKHDKNKDCLKENLLFYQFDISFEQNKEKYISHPNFEEKFEINFNYSLLEDTLSTIIQHQKTAKDCSFGKPKIFFDFDEILQTNCLNDLENLISQVIKISTERKQFHHLKEFLSSFKTFNSSKSKSRDETALASILDSIKNAEDKYKIYYYLGLDAFDLEIDKLMKSVVYKMRNLKNDFIYICLNFHILLKFMNHTDLTTISILTGYLMIELKSNSNDGFLMKTIIETYDKLQESDLQKKSLNYLKPRVYQAVLKLDSSKPKYLCFEEIKFLLNSTSNSNKTIISWIENIDILFQLMEIRLQIDLSDDCYMEMGKRLRYFLETQKDLKLSDQQIVTLFDLLKTFDDKYFKLVVNDEDISNLIVDLINQNCDKDDLFEKISNNLIKFNTIFNSRFISTIILPKKNNSSFSFFRNSNVKDNSKILFKKLFKLSFNNGVLRTNLENDLISLYRNKPLIILENLEEIYQVCQTDTNTNFMKKLFGIIEIHLDKFEKGELSNFIENVESESIITEAIEYMIQYQIEKEINSKCNRQNVIKRIKEVAEKPHFDYKKKKKFINYILNKISLHTKIEDPEEMIKWVFEEVNQSKIKELIELIDSSKVNRSKSVEEFKDILKKEFDDLKNGNLTVDKFNNFKSKYKEDSGLKILHEKINPHLQFSYYPFKIFEESKSKLQNIKSIIEVWCRDCNDYDDTANDINDWNNKQDQKSVNELVKYCEDFWKNIDWNKLSILNKDISFKNIFKLNIESMNRFTVNEKLQNLEEEIKNKFEVKMKKIEKEFGKMTRDEVKRKLDVDNDDLIPLFKSFFCSEEYQETFLMYNKIIKDQSILRKYVDVYESVITQLDLKMKIQENNLESIKKILSSNPETLPLRNFEQVSVIMKNSFDVYDDIDKLSKKFNFVIGFKEKLKFLQDQKSQFDRFKELVTDFREFEIKWDDINDLEVILSFFESFKTNGNNQQESNLIFENLKDFEREFDELTIKQLCPDIYQKIKHFTENFDEYKILFEQSTSRSESLKQWIIAFMTESYFTFNLSQDVVKLNITDIPSLRSLNKREYSYEDLEEKRNVILIKGSLDANKINQITSNILINNSSIVSLSNTTNQAFNHQEAYVKFFRQLEIMNYLILQMKNYGYDFSKFKNDFSIIDGTFEGLIGAIKELEIKNNKFKEHISRAYSNEFLFSFLHHDMLHQLVKALKNDQKNDFRNRHILYYLGFTDHESVKSLFKKNIETITPERICHDMESLINKHLKHQSRFSSENSYKSNKKLSATQYYVVKIPKRDGQTVLYKTILGISVVANDKLPDFHNILFCNSTSVVSKLHAFVNRVFNCPSNQVFMIVLPETLEYQNQQEMINFIHKISTNTKRKSYLFILYCSGDSELAKYFLEHKNKSSFSLEDSVYNNDINSKIENIKQNVTVVTSSQSLVGKTRWIIDESKSKYPGSKIIHLRLTGIIDYDIIFNNLIDLIDTENLVIHLDIGPIHKNSINVLDEFLFSIIFLNTFQTVNKVIVIPKDTKIFIEFDRSMVEEKTSIEFFQFGFNKKEDIDSGINKLIDISDVSLLFFQSYENNTLVDWRVTDLEQPKGFWGRLFSLEFSKKETPVDLNMTCLKQLNYPQDETEVKIAEANVGLDYNKTQLTTKINIPDNLKQKFFEFLKKNKKNRKPDGMLVHQLIFQRVLHFMAYNYSKCGIMLAFENSHKEIAEFIFKSTKYLANSSFKSLQLQQMDHRQIFNNQRTGGDNEEELDKIKTNLQQWNNENTVFMTFNQGFPIIVYKNKNLIPNCFLKEEQNNGNNSVRFFEIGDGINNELRRKSKSEIHHGYFKELSHLNDKLVTCKFCDKCCNRYYQDICKDCGYECISGEDYWNSNRHSKYVTQINNEIPEIKGIKKVEETHQIKALDLFLKDLFGDEKANEMKPKDPKQIICLTCKKITESITDCKECSNKLITAKDYFENNKDKPIFVKINDENVRNNTLKKINPNPDIKTYHVFDSDINNQFISFISESLLQRKYVLTLDNFSKLLQIHVRAKSRLPVILMGETGCGKTSSIRFLCRYLLDDHFEFYPMHAGISESDVVNKVTAFFKHCEIYSKKDCWILFDEFNTSDAIGLIKTIMIDRRLNNIRAPVNAIFIAACNPFKAKRTKIIKEHLVGLKRNLHETRAEQTSLVYNVHPLPESLFHFTFDFGQLSQNDERQYAETMLNRSLFNQQDDQINKFKDKELNEICNICLDVSKYLKIEFDLSSSSFRDLRRFEIIYAFFKDKYFPAIQKVESEKKKENMQIPNEENMQTLSEESMRILREENMQKLNQKTLVLSVMVCYCFRLSDKNKRREVIEIVKKYIEITTDNFELIVKEETERLLENFQLEKEIIKNRALSENILSMFVCLLNKIPLIIIGKPGSSKSLSLQLVFQKLKGIKSTEKLFKEFDELVMVSYQGSEYSTSKSIEFIFDKAEGLLKAKNEVVKGRIPVVVFDEIGLAELSKNNPLKVLHSKLEMEDVKVGFLGISNWYLDSSKMNRVLTVSRTDPDDDELTQTAIHMCDSLLKSTGQIQKCFMFLAIVYSEHKKEIELKGEKNKGVAGLRDFYHLIKQTAKEYSNHGPKEDHVKGNDISEGFYKAAVYSIQRNFSYNIEYSQQMSRKLRGLMNMHKSYVLQPITTDDLLRGNLTDPFSRSLMIITDHVEVHNRIYRILGNPTNNHEIPKREYRVLIGSQFEEDIDSEAYCVEVISQVIYYMNQNVILVMNQFEALYTSLYDLFNQNFKREGSKDYCRIVQGTISKCLYPVHKHFKVVLFLTKEQLEKADEPLVNRFEKYSLTPNDFLTSAYTSKINKIRNAYDLILGTKTDEDRVIKGKQVFGNFNESSFYKWIDKIKSFQSDDNNNKSDSVLEEIMEIMKNTSSLHLARELFKNQGEISRREVDVENFLKYKKRSLIDLIKNISETQHPTKTIVYTFSSILEDFYQKIKDSIDKSISCMTLENSNQNRDYQNNDVRNTFNFFQTDLLSVKSEKTLKYILKKFIDNNQLKLLIIKVNGMTETKHMMYLQSTLSNLLNNHKGISKHAIICVHYKEYNSLNNQSFDVHSEWNEVFIDDLSKGLDELSKKILIRPDWASAVKYSVERIKIEFDSIIDKIIFDKTKIGGTDKNYLDRMIGYFKDFTKKYGNDVRDLLITKIHSALSDDKSPADSKTVYEGIDELSDYVNNSETFVKRIELAVNRKFESKLKELINLMLNRSIFQSLNFFMGQGLNDHKQFIIGMIENLISTAEINNPMGNFITESLISLVFPFSRVEHEVIMKVDRDKFNHDENVIDLTFANYLSMSYFERKGYEIINIYKSSRLQYLLIDIISLHLNKSNAECPSVDHLLLVFEKVIFSKLFEVYKLFILSPDLTTNLIVLLVNLLSIVNIENILNLNFFEKLNKREIKEDDGNVNQNKQSLNYKETKKYFQDLINILTNKALEKSVLLSNFSNFKTKYSILKHSIENLIDSSDIQVLNSDSFDLLLMIEEFIDESPIKNSLIYKIVNNDDQLLNKLDIDNFSSTISKLRKLLPGCSHEKSTEERLLTFEVLYYQKYINQISIGDNKERMKIIFKEVFSRIEECKKFASFMNPIINTLIEKCELENSVSLLLEGNERFDEKTEENLGEWFDDCLRDYPRRLPYLIISVFVTKVKSVLDKCDNIILSNTFQKILIKLENLDKVELVFTKSSLIYITLIQIFTNVFIDKFARDDKPNIVVSQLLNTFLNSDSEFAKSFQIHICKKIKKIYQNDNDKLTNFLKDSQESWTKNLYNNIEIEKINWESISECYRYNSDHNFKYLIEYFKKIENSERRSLNECLDYLKLNKNNNGLLTFYSLIINFCYFKRFTNENLVKHTLEGIKKLRTEFSDLLGNVGYSFIENVLTNFNSNGPLHLKQDSDQLKIKQNSSILFAFASVLSHKNQNNYFSHLLFGNQSKISFSHLKNNYLPGMILPLSETTSTMIRLLEDVKLKWRNEGWFFNFFNYKKLWKCNRDCDYFFMFDNSGRPEVQQIRIMCPICKKFEIGAKSKHVPLDHLIPYTKEVGVKYMNDKINAYKNSYSMGYFNFESSIKDLNGEGVNVSYSTTNALNFITNSLILVLNELKITDDDISTLITNPNPLDELLKKISNNFEKFKSQFRLNDFSIKVNLLSAKISSEVGCKNPSIDKPELYNEFEKNLDSDVLNPLFINNDQSFNEYFVNLNKWETNSDLPDSIKDYIDELNKDNCNKYPLTYHLRLENPELTFESMKEKFYLNKSNITKYPITHFIFLHFKDLEKMNVILAYKDFYDEFRKKHNRILLRTVAENCSLKFEENTLLSPECIKKLEKFIKNWNEIVQNFGNVQYQFQDFKLTKINRDLSLTQVLPNRLRGNSVTDVVFGMSSLIKIQNELLKESRSKTEGIINHSWDSINKQTLFSWDQEEIRKKLNENCILTDIDYGRCGTMTLSFDKYEQLLINDLSKLRMFKDNKSLVPHFDYQFETKRLNEDLTVLKNSGIQLALTQQESDQIEEILKRINALSSTCAYAQILDFCQNILLPRAILSIQPDQSQSVMKFIEQTVSKSFIDKLGKFFELFKTLKMNQLFSFLLFVEILVFKENFGDNFNIVTRLTTDEKDIEWTDIVRQQSPEKLVTVVEPWSLKENWKVLEKALMRLVLNTTFDNGDFDNERIQLSIKNEALYDLSCNIREFDNFCIIESVKLKHCLLLLRSLQKHFKENNQANQIPMNN